MATEAKNLSNAAVANNSDAYRKLLTGGSATIQPGGSFTDKNDNNRTVTFDPTVKFSGGKMDKYNRYVLPARMVLELFDDPEAIKKLRLIAK